MGKRNLTVAVLATVSAIALSGYAHAVPIGVTVVSENTIDLPSAGSVVNTLPTGPSVPLVQIISGSSSGVYRSPYEDSDGAIRTGYTSTLYTSIQGGAEGTWNISGHILSLVWGSPDTYNQIEFYSGLNGTGSSVGFITGGGGDLTIPPPGAPQLNHDWVTLFVTGLFQSVTLRSINQNAFEFTSLSGCAAGTACGPPPNGTPIPGAAMLFGSVLAGGAGFGAWRRRRKAA
jgi:hypothetical protein